MKNQNTIETPNTAADKIAHTPGPWEHEKGNTGIFHIVKRSTKNCYLEIATVFETSMLKSEPEHAEADARLIAAAPEQYQALKDASQWCEFNGCGVGTSAEPPWLENVNAAISKAEGTKDL